MRPVLFELFGLSVNSYGLSKAAAALVAGFLLVREFRRLGWDEDRAWTLVMATTLFGFVGAKAYFLTENGGSISLHHFGASGFTWYGGFLAGTLTVLVLARRWRLPLVPLAGVLASPLAAAYAIGRVGCFLAGDGTYGRPSDLPWAMAFPDGTVPTTVPVHPTALYETIAALLLAVGLWQLRTRVRPVTLIAVYALVSGVTRLLIEELRINAEGWLGLTQPQLWSVALAIAGLGLLAHAVYRPDRTATDDAAARTRQQTSSGTSA
ncbi:MAG: prolipoprotein diacylglyceryl transferase [Nocardioides sp.]|nr:prolipoprotein diacylglyceryl transferase [Nocardioides sp.]